jgi:TorA maturation chaperone TorD
MKREIQLKRHFARADVYRLLSACYYEPDAAFLEEELFGQMKSSMAKASQQHVPAVVALEEAFKGSDLDELKLDYSRLFLGPFEIPAKPYGSVYLDGEKVVMGDSTVQTMELYREGGFNVAADFSEMPDHVAVELEYLYLLSYNQGQTAESDGDGAEKLRILKKRFLDEQLGRWIAPFTEAMRTHAETEFYKKLADLTEQFVLENKDEIPEVAIDQ